MMKQYLIHCTSVSGHHLEYIHHLYMGAMERSNNNYRFVLPSQFREKKGLYDWPIAPHITIEQMRNVDEEIDNYGLIKKSYLKAKNLNRYVAQYGITDVILIDLISYLPFLPLFIDGKVNVKGILYRIYLYDWKSNPCLKKLVDILKYVLFVKFEVFEKIFILNDSSAASYLNKLYHTSKFFYLPDPVSSNRDYKGMSVRKKYGISSDKILFLHPGGMLPYKGTIEILRALDLMDESNLSKISVVFAGRVTSSIRKEFFNLLYRLEGKVELIVLEGFLSFTDLADLFVSCDYVLIPYKVKCQSSGIVGHAAYYNKPVVVATGGVVGKMVKKWHLGPLLSSSSSVEICRFLCNPRPFISDGGKYVKSHSVESFCEALFL